MDDHTDNGNARMLNRKEKPEHFYVMNYLRTSPCPFLTKDGKCEKFQSSKKSDGAPHDCFYYHNASDQRRCPLINDRVELYRPALCKHHSDDPGKCPYGLKCKFSHGFHELLFHPSIYKIKLCIYGDNNYSTCPSGKYCSFAHGIDDLRNRPITDHTIASICNFPPHLLEQNRNLYHFSKQPISSKSLSYPQTVNHHSMSSSITTPYRKSAEYYPRYPMRFAGAPQKYDYDHNMMINVPLHQQALICQHQANSLSLHQSNIISQQQPSNIMTSNIIQSNVLPNDISSSLRNEPYHLIYQTDMSSMRQQSVPINMYTNYQDKSTLPSQYQNDSPNKYDTSKYQHPKYNIKYDNPRYTDRNYDQNKYNDIKYDHSKYNDDKCGHFTNNSQHSKIDQFFVGQPEYFVPVSYNCHPHYNKLDNFEYYYDHDYENVYDFQYEYNQNNAFVYDSNILNFEDISMGMSQIDLH